MLLSSEQRFFDRLPLAVGDLYGLPVTEGEQPLARVDIMDLFHFRHIDQAVVVGTDETGRSEIFLEKLEQADTAQDVAVFEMEVGNIPDTTDIEDVVAGNPLDRSTCFDKNRPLNGCGEIHGVTINNGSFSITKIA